MTNENSIPATFGILCLALAIQHAGEAYRSESILARALKQPAPPTDYGRCRALFEIYAPALEADGLGGDRITFECLLREKPPQVMLDTLPGDLPQKWRFSPRRGWEEVELLAS